MTRERTWRDVDEPSDREVLREMAQHFAESVEAHADDHRGVSVEMRPNEARVIADALSDVPALLDVLHRLAMLGLQSQRYVADPDYRDAVDDALARAGRLEGGEG